MAAPLSGIGQQQVPLSQPFQPGGSDQSREVRQNNNQQPRENEIQSRGSAASQTQEANVDNQNVFQKNGGNVISASSSDGGTNEQGRGSVVDITV